MELEIEKPARQKEEAEMVRSRKRDEKMTDRDINSNRDEGDMRWEKETN